MKRVIMHWTAGGPAPNEVDKQHYHYMVDSLGHFHKGIFSPEANLNCVEGQYAAHTGGGNTGAIGVALCGMEGFKNAKASGEFLINRLQLEACLDLVAHLCQKYNIKISPETVMTHYEFGIKNPKTTSFGKIDIIYLPPFPSLKANEVGNFLRKKVEWYFKKERN